MARATPSQSFDDLYYLRPGFDCKSLTVPQLRNILYKHDIDFPSSAKKTDLQEYFKKHITPHSAEWLSDHEDAMSNPSSEGIKDADPPAKVIYSETATLSDYEHDEDVEEENVDSQKTWSQVDGEKSETDDDDEGFFDKEGSASVEDDDEDDDEEDEETETDMDESETDVDEVATDVDEMETDVDVDMVDDIEAQLQREMEAHLVISTPPKKKAAAGKIVAPPVSLASSMSEPVVSSPRSARKVKEAPVKGSTPVKSGTTPTKKASPKKTPTKKATPSKKVESQTPVKKAEETPVKSPATAKTIKKVVETEKKPAKKAAAKKVTKEADSTPVARTGGRALRPRKAVNYAE